MCQLNKKFELQGIRVDQLNLRHNFAFVAQPFFYWFNCFNGHSHETAFVVHKIFQYSPYVYVLALLMFIDAYRKMG